MDSFEDLKLIFDVDINNILTETIDNDSIKSTILSMNKSQLWNGKSNTGEDLRPYYSEDPYFKTKQQAEAYRMWKKAITKNSSRYDDAPNLFINGYFYRSITIEKNSQNMFEFGVTNSFSKDIFDKYPLALGLTEDNEKVLVWDYLQELFSINLKKALTLS